MRVGRLVRARKPGAWTLVAIGAPLWLLGTTALAQSAQKRPDWPAIPPEEPPVSQRLWPPPEPPRPPRATPANEEPAAPEPPPAPPPAATVAPAADPNQRKEPPVEPAPPARQWPANGVFVELRSDDPRTRIDQVSPDGHTVPACVAPCRRILWRNVTYVVQSERAPPTSTFLLPDSTNRVTLDVQAGSQTQRYAGMAFIAAGGIAALFGLTRASQSGSSAGSSLGGIELLGLGAATALTGLVLVRMGHTSVTSSTGTTFSERGRKPRAAPAIALTPQGLVF